MKKSEIIESVKYGVENQFNIISRNKNAILLNRSNLGTYSYYTYDIGLCKIEFELNLGVVLSSKVYEFKINGKKLDLFLKKYCK